MCHTCRTLKTLSRYLLIPKDSGTTSNLPLVPAGFIRRPRML